MSSGRCKWIAIKGAVECPYVGGGSYNRLTITEIEAACLKHHIESRGKDLNIIEANRNKWHTCYQFEIWESDDFVGDFATITCAYDQLEEGHKQAMSAYKRSLTREGD